MIKKKQVAEEGSMEEPNMNIKKIMKEIEHLDSESSRQPTSQSSQDGLKGKSPLGERVEREIEIQGINMHDAFWKKLKLAAEKKIGSEEAERLCKAFQQVHHQLVYEELSLDACRNFVNTTRSSTTE